MKIFFQIIGFVMLFGLVGCVAYGPDGLFGGYGSLQLNEDTYKVYFRGNGFNSDAMVQRELLKRCAQITVQKGFKYFDILDRSRNVRVKNINEPGVTHTYGSENTYGNLYYNNFNSQSTFNEDTYTTGGIHTKANFYTEFATIRLTNVASKTSFNAKMLLKELKSPKPFLK